MKEKQILCAASLALALLLCACQTPAETGDAASGTDIPLTETGGEGEAGGETSEEAESHLPPAPPVCETVFTETEGFPYPFEEGVLRDKEGHILLSLGQALYDYDTMWTLLEENFPYFPAIEEDLGIDWRRVREEYQKELEDCEENDYISQLAFMRTIHHCLQEFQMVGHLSLIDLESRRACIEMESNGGLYKNISDLLSNTKTEQFYEDEWAWQTFWMDDTASAANTFETEETIPIARRADVPAGGIVMGYVHGIPYIKISTFSGWNSGTYTFLSDFLSTAKTGEHLIIDVRGNGGGNNTPWLRGIVAPLAHQDTIESYMFFGVKAGALNSALYPELENEPWNLVYEDDAWQAEYPYIQPGKLEGVDLFIKSRQFSIKKEGENFFRGKIWVLIDGGCYSATDKFVYFCKETGFATLVGTATGGNGIGIMPYVMALPYSGLAVQYEAFLSFNPDGTCNGTTGIQPDIPLKYDMSALEICLYTIESES